MAARPDRGILAAHSGVTVRTGLAILATLFIMHLGAFVTYGAAATWFDLQLPAGVSPGQMFGSVFLQKLGLAVAFVLLYRYALDAWRDRWPRYAAVWLAMLVIMEAGQAVGPGYSWPEAFAGMVAEAIYCPLSAWCVAKLLKN